MNSQNVLIKVTKNESKPIVEVVIEIGQLEDEALDTKGPSLKELFDTEMPDIRELLGHKEITKTHYCRFPRKSSGNDEC